MKDNSTEKNEKDYISYQCHGDHLDCIFDNSQKELETEINTVFNKGSVYGQTETSFNLEDDGGNLGKVVLLEYSTKPRDPIVFRICVACLKNSNQIVSIYPFVKEGALISIKITKIIKWENELEAWIEGELPDGRLITFYDVDYPLNKNNYKVDATYRFIIGAFAYSASRPEPGFDLTGQDAINFNDKLGEMTEYDETGNALPVHFSTEKLCALLQDDSRAPDEAYYISTVGKISTSSSLNRKFYHYKIRLKAENNDEKNDIYIPCYLKKAKNIIVHAPQLHGVLWLTGFNVGN